MITDFDPYEAHRARGLNAQLFDVKLSKNPRGMIVLRYGHEDMIETARAETFPIGLYDSAEAAITDVRKWLHAYPTAGAAVVKLTEKLAGFYFQ